MNYKVAYYMDIGMRDNQEDCLFVDGNIIQQDIFKKTDIKKTGGATTLFAVCDGMGGHSKGEWASRFVCEKLKNHMIHGGLSQEVIYNIFSEIQADIEKKAVGDSGTTVAFVALNSNKAMIFNAGDSRVYKITREGILYMSHDHSYVQTMIDEGYLSEDDAFHHPFRNVIEFGLGEAFKAEWSNNGTRGFMKEDVLNADEYYLLCSDGLNDILQDDEIYRLLSPNPFDKFSEFIEYFKERMKDNLSFIVIGNK
jgi:serine/threonine protein phosphatase PrpC